MRPVGCLVLFLCLLSSALAQQTSANSSSVVPALVNFTGVLSDVSGKPLTSLIGITFSLYKDSQGGAPLWMETQNVQPDKRGHYSATLGSTTSRGLSSELFVSGEARWLGVQVQGQAEQPRILLLSVPYALKAKDAETLGGMPASAFAHVAAGTLPGTASANARPSSAASVAAGAVASAPAVSGSGTKNFIPIWRTSTALGNSALFQNNAGYVGLATLTPTQKFEVDFGNLLARGPQNFRKAGDTAFLYVGDTSHLIGAIWNTGLTIGAYQAPQALFIQDRTGNVGIGTTAPSAVLNVVSSSGIAGVFSSDKTGFTGLAATGAAGNSSIVGGTGLHATGGTNMGGPDSRGDGGLGISAKGGDSTWGSGGAGIRATGGANNNFQSGGGGGDGGDFEGGTVGSGGTGGIGIRAIGGNGNAGGCGGIFTGGDNGGAACVGGGSVFSDPGADGITVSSVPSVTGFPVYAGYFNGDVNVTGAIFAGKKDFRIDHPLDPANKYLNHASVESSEMKNIYDGTVVTDGSGDAVVQLPVWFETLNGDFRYQLTVIGQFAQAIVASEINNHQFRIKTDKPNVKVSWQVTGVRHDAFARTHPLILEEQKPTKLRGYYIHPELYGQAPEKQVEWARRPAMMKRMRDIQEQQAKQAKHTEAALALPKKSTEP